MTSILLEPTVKGLKKRIAIPEKKYIRIIYQDINADYLNNDKQILVDNRDAVHQQILNVLTTVPGERPFEPTFGSRVPFLLFEPMVEASVVQLKFETIGALNKFMPYITIDNDKSEIIAYPDDGNWEVKIYYSINGEDYRYSQYNFNIS